MELGYAHTNGHSCSVTSTYLHRTICGSMQDKSELPSVVGLYHLKVQPEKLLVENVWHGIMK